MYVLSILEGEDGAYCQGACCQKLVTCLEVSAFYCIGQKSAPLGRQFNLNE